MSASSTQSSSTELLVATVTPSPPSPGLMTVSLIVPPAISRVLLTCSSAVTLRLPLLVTRIFSSEMRLVTQTGPPVLRMVIVRLSGLVMTTLSSTPGTVPPAQLLGSSQLPLKAAVQVFTSPNTMMPMSVMPPGVTGTSGATPPLVSPPTSPVARIVTAVSEGIVTVKVKKPAEFVVVFSPNVLATLAPLTALPSSSWTKPSTVVSTVASTTRNCTVEVTPSFVAVIKQRPGPTPVTRPSSPTVMQSGLLVPYVVPNERCVMSAVPPPWSVAVTTSWAVSVGVNRNSGVVASIETTISGAGSIGVNEKSVSSWSIGSRKPSGAMTTCAPSQVARMRGRMSVPATAGTLKIV